MPSETASTPERRNGRDRRRKRAEHLVWVSVTGVIAIVLIAMLTVVGVTRLNDVVSRVDRQQQALTAQQRELAELRAEQSRAACLQQNNTAQGQRDAFAQSVEAAIPPDATDPRIIEFKRRYLEAVNRSIRFRDCSPTGIAAYFANPPAAVPCEPDGKGFCR